MSTVSKLRISIMWKGDFSTQIRTQLSLNTTFDDQKGNPKTLSINYLPIVQNDLVEKFMVVVEDSSVLYQDINDKKEALDQKELSFQKIAQVLQG